MTERARYSIHGIPNDLTTSDRINIRRLKVDQDDTNYVLGTQFRISIPLTVDDVAPVVLKFESPIDFELIEQGLETHQSGITFEAYRSTQGTETGVYNTAVPVYKNNIQSTVMGYTQQVTVTTGGGFTPDVGQTAVETLNALSASATAQRSTVFAGASGKRGLPAGIYYLSFSKLGGLVTSLGVYSLIFNENP